MYVHFNEGVARDGSNVNAQHQVTVCGALIVVAQLVAGQVPMGVEPVRVPGSEQQFPGAVGFRQFA